VVLNGTTFVHKLTGIEVSAEYEVKLTCTFADEDFDCGYSTIFSSKSSAYPTYIKILRRHAI
jgi:hypothetical protein